MSAGSPPPLIELVDVSHAADGKHLLRGIDWRIQRHTHWGVLGPNGAGKTTLVRILGGNVWPNAGGYVLREGERLPDLHAMRRGIGWVHCELGRRIPSRERVRGLVESGRYAELGLRPPIRTETSALCREQADALIGRLHFQPLADRRFVTLSQGEQQIVLLARALMAEPMLLILDEPCAGLDPHARETFLEALSRVIDDDDAPATVMVTHHLEEVLPSIRHLLLLKAGQIHRQGSPAECLTAEVIDDVYGRRPSAIRVVDGRHWPIWSGGM